MTCAIYFTNDISFEKMHRVDFENEKEKHSFYMREDEFFKKVRDNKRTIKTFSLHGEKTTSKEMQLLQLLKSCRKIENLYIIQFPLTESFFKGCRKMKKLKELYLIDCSLNKVPGSVNKLKRLRHLNLTRNPGVSVPLNLNTNVVY